MIHMNLIELQKKRQHSYDIRTIARASLSSVDVQLLIHSVFPNPPLTLAFPHPISQLKSCQNTLT